jgi:predicted DNA-binding transcriptional regulator AlpA
MTKLAELDIPVLEGGYINLTEAADRLGWTRSYMYKKASRFGEEGGFASLRKIGSQASYVVLESEVEEILRTAVEQREAAAQTQVEKDYTVAEKTKAAVEKAAADPTDVVERPKRKSRAKKKPDEAVVAIVANTLGTSEAVAEVFIGDIDPEDPPVVETQPEESPVVEEEPAPVVEEEEPKDAFKELTLEEIMAQI